MKLSYSIKPFIRDDKPVKSNGKYPIYFSVRLNKVVLKIPSAKDIEEKFWDKKDGIAKKGCGNSQLLNSLLDKRMNEFNEFMLKQENLGREVTVNMIKHFFQRKQSLNFYDFWEAQAKNFVGIKKTSTLNSYAQTLKILKEFDPSLSFGDINLDLLEQFDRHLRVERKNSDGGVFNRHKCFKAIIKLAVRKEMLQNNPYDDFKIKAAKGNRNFLSIEEVKKLMIHDFGKQKSNYRMILDMFLFACFSGVRFSDLTNLSWDHVKEDCIVFKMEKTSKLITIPLLPVAKNILDKYRGQDKLCKTVFDNLTNQYVNRELKNIMTAAGIHKKITFHCARHTFACTLIESKTPMIYLKDLLGHSSISTTEIYAKTMQAGLFESMKNLAANY